MRNTQPDSTTSPDTACVAHCAYSCALVAHQRQSNARQQTSGMSVLVLVCDGKPLCSDLGIPFSHSDMQTGACHCSFPREPPLARSPALAFFPQLLKRRSALLCHSFLCVALSIAPDIDSDTYICIKPLTSLSWCQRDLLPCVSECARASVCLCVGQQKYKRFDLSLSSAFGWLLSS